jgi:hypothetical protein
MVKRCIQTLKEDDLYEFLGLFNEDYIRSIILELYNGTCKAEKDLPNGSTLTTDRLSLYSLSIEMMQNDLKKVDWNQIQKCEISLENPDSEEYTTVTLSLLHCELDFHNHRSTIPIPKLLEFAEKKRLYKVTIGYN